MLEDRQVDRSEEIQRRTGPTFYFATRFLPERVREPTHVSYAFFRLADEVVDDPDAIDRSAEEKRRELEHLRAQALGEAPPEHPVLAAFDDVRVAYDVPDHEIDAFVDAMAMDAHRRRYEDVDQLRAYVRGSAAAVGAMMTAIMEPEDRERAIPHAHSLGEALQLTNFLRDVREDVVERDRIYLPQSTLERHGADARQIADLSFSEAVGEAIREELLRAERYYRHGVAGIDLLPRDCQFPVLLAAVLYADYHRSIRARNYDVLSEAPELRRRRTLSLFTQTRLRWQFSSDPVAIFDAVSPIEMRNGAERVEPAPLPVPSS